VVHHCAATSHHLLDISLCTNHCAARSSYLDLASNCAARSVHHDGQEFVYCRDFVVHHCAATSHQLLDISLCTNYCAARSLYNDLANNCAARSVHHDGQHRTRFANSCAARSVHHDLQCPALFTNLVLNCAARPVRHDLCEWVPFTNLVHNCAARQLREQWSRVLCLDYESNQHHVEFHMDLGWAS